MHVSILTYDSEAADWSASPGSVGDGSAGQAAADDGRDGNPDLVIGFLPSDVPEPHRAYRRLQEAFGENTVACSTAGEICNGQIAPPTGVGLAVHFENTPLRIETARREDHADSFDLGRALAGRLKADDLAAVLVFSDGLLVNGTRLVAGLRDVLGDAIPVTGGLAGDDDRFGATFVGGKGVYAKGQVAAVGFYGDRIRCQSGSYGGWDVFGPRRVITRATDNVLYELDGQPALDLYCRYLGEEAEDLPGSGLLFPLEIFPPDRREHSVVRTIIGIDREAGSMIFAGDMPEGHHAQLMTGNFDRLIGGAAKSVEQLSVPAADSFALLVSCVGRRLLLGQHNFEEVEAVSSRLPGVPHIGFYSYGEIARHHQSSLCELHNQTMTVALFSET